MLYTSTCTYYLVISCYVHIQLYASVIEVLFGFSSLFNRLQISLIFSMYLFTTYVSSEISIIISIERTSLFVHRYLEALERRDRSTQHIRIHIFSY